MRNSRGLAHVDAWGRRVRTLRDREVDANASPIDLHAGALVLRYFRVLLVLEVHEAEASGPPGLSGIVMTVKRQAA